MSIHCNSQQDTMKKNILLNKRYLYSEPKYAFLANRPKMSYTMLIRVILTESADIFTQEMVIHINLSKKIKDETLHLLRYQSNPYWLVAKFKQLLTLY